MLTPEHKKSNKLTGTIFATLLFVTASSAMYDTPTLAVADSNYEVKVVTEYKVVPLTTPSLLDKLGDFQNLTNTISTLESDLLAAENYVYITKVQSELAAQQQRDLYVDIDQALQDLYQYVGKTPYVLGASTPRAWDCSGLTLWFYETYRGIKLAHSATTQQREGQVVDAPIPGDIVAFVYNGYKNAHHVGIYLGGGLMIHAINPNRDTVVENINDFADGEHSRVEYIRY